MRSSGSNRKSTDISGLITASVILGLSFLTPTVVSNAPIRAYIQNKIEKQGELDIVTIEKYLVSDVVTNCERIGWQQRTERAGFFLLLQPTASLSS